MASSYTTRVDLHCHSRASTEADEALLLAIQCPESFSEPEQVYAQAKRRGMRFVTITDHDCIDGVAELLAHDDVLIGEELTCYFPEDRCKMHVLIWGISNADHDALQAVADDVYACAEYIERNNIAHAVAHPLYRQNDVLNRWHIERLLLMFKGFECLNGAHSMLHRQAFEPLLDELDAKEIHRLEESHGMTARWPIPWQKVRTAGSDDHGLFNIGRTWTEFPEDVRTVADVLDCLRDGRCRPGGEAGSSLKLAHNFYGVGVRYYTQQLTGGGATFESAMMQRVVGDTPSMSTAGMALGALRHYGSGLLGKAAELVGLREPPRGTQMLGKLFASAAMSHISEHPALTKAFKTGQPVLAEHESFFGLLNEIGRDVSEGIAGAVGKALDGGQMGPIFDAVSAVLAHQAFLLPYYFALFHQNQERQLLAQITGHGRRVDGQTLRIGVFTDLFEGDGDAARFARDLVDSAQLRDLDLTVHTSSHELAEHEETAHRKNFKPLVARAIPDWDLEGVIPPVLEILEWADRKQFDAIVVNTPGPMGLTGWLVAKMLRVPVIGVSHDHLPAVVFSRTGGDFRTTAAASGYSKWFNSQAARMMVPSRSARAVIEKTGIASSRISLLPMMPARKRTAPHVQQSGLWERLHIKELRRVIVPPQILSNHDMKLIAGAFAQLCQRRNDVALVVLGGGPWVSILKKLKLPIYYAPAGNPTAFYAGGDMLFYPAREAFSGGVVVEAQAAGLPVLVSASGSAREFMDEDLTGLVLPADDAAAWASAINDLLDDEPRRQHMSRTGMQRVRRLEPSRAFEAIWEESLRVVAESNPETAARDAAPNRGSASGVAEVSRS